MLSYFADNIIPIDLAFATPKSVQMPVGNLHPVKY